MAVPIPVPLGRGGGGVLTAIGACAGTCLGPIFTRLIFAGEIESARGAKCLMMWLQIFFVGLLILVISPNVGWIETGCKGAGWFTPNLGICECQNTTLEDLFDRYNRTNSSSSLAIEQENGEFTLILDDENISFPDLPRFEDYIETVSSCMSYGLATRMTFSSQFLFMFMGLLGISGCGAGASKFFPVFKFIMIPVIFFVTLFISNGFFIVVGDINGGLITAVFSVGQTIIFLDLLMTWNDSWTKEAVKRDAQGAAGSRCLFGGLLAFALLFLVMAIGLAVYLFLTYPAFWISITAGLVAGFVLLIASLFIEHGNLTTAAGLMFWFMWMIWQAIAVEKAQTGDDIDGASNTLKAIVCFITLIALLFASDPPDATPKVEQIKDLANTTSHVDAHVTRNDKETELTNSKEKEGDPEKGDTTVIVNNSNNVINVILPEQKEPSITSCDFAVQCFVHLALSGYVLSLIIPVFYQGYASNAVVFHWSAVVLSAFLFGFSLIAPSVFTNRDFTPGRNI